MNGPKNKRLLYGKTIKTIEIQGINAWTVYFTDGSSVELWAETDGPAGLPTLNLESFKEI